MRLLGLGQLEIVGLQRHAELGGFCIFGLQIPCDSFAGLFGLGCDQMTALGR